MKRPNVTRQLEANINVLLRVGCQFFACNGPEHRWEAMKTCAVCGEIRNTRRLIRNLRAYGHKVKEAKEAKEAKRAKKGGAK